MTKSRSYSVSPVRPPKEGPIRRHRRPLIRGHRIGNIVGTSIIRLVGAILLEQNDEWAIQRCYMTLKLSALGSVSDNAIVSLLVMAA